MKKIGLLFLAVVMVLGVAGCNSNKDADPVGTWMATLKNDCSGASSNWELHLKVNGTFTYGDTLGTWEVDGNNITMNITLPGWLWFPAKPYILTGEVNGGAMTGNYVADAATGCWTAVRTSTTP